MKIRITYSKATEESSEHGEFSETGWVHEEGVGVEHVADALGFLYDEGVIQASSSEYHPGIWYSTGWKLDYDDEEGVEEQLSYHPVGFTAKQEKALYRLLKKKCII